MIWQEVCDEDRDNYGRFWFLLQDGMALGRELYAIHYNDNHGAKDDHVAPFLGRLNHDEVMHALIDVDFEGIL